MPLTQYVDGVVSDVDAEEVLIALDMSEHIGCAFPRGQFPEHLARYGQPVRVSLAADGRTLVFEAREVPPFIGPPTREGFELEQWLKSD
jgi:hypothetical protein